MKSAGIVLAAIGIIMMLYTGFNYVTEKRVIDIGSLKVDKEQNHFVSWSPIVGGVLLVGGILLIVTNRGKNTG